MRIFEWGGRFVIVGIVTKAVVDMSSCTSEVPDADKELLRDGFADELVAVGVDQVRVAEFVQLLRDCSVTTRGALSGYSPRACLPLWITCTMTKALLLGH